MILDRRQLLTYGAALAGASSLAGLPRHVLAAPQYWDMADEYGEAALTGKASKYFVQLVNERIGDELSITYHGGGALGLKSVDHFDAVEDGAVPIAVTLATQLGGIDPLFDMTSLPFLVQTPQEAYQLWRAAKAEYARIFDDHGMVLLWAMPNPPSGIHARRPIDQPSALDGLRIRTYDANGTRTLAAAGASPLQISWSDLIPQLSTGGIDAVLTSADGGVQLSIWDYLSDFTELNYAMALFVTHVNKDSFMALSEEAQQALHAISDEVDAYNWEIMQATVEESYRIMGENGMTITRNPPQAVFDRLQDAAAEVRSAWLDKVGERGEKILAEFESRKG